MSSPTLRVAVVGAGPAGLYVADALTFQEDVPVQVDLIDRLPTPFGLLRYGVAPDHLKMKALSSTLQRTLDHDDVRFFGNVEVGRDVTVDELRERYSAVVYTYGASADRRLGIDGEDLAGSHSATEFVNWYSGHPDIASDRFDLSGVTTAVVVGVGNVAVDVARMLVKDPDQIATTDVPTAVVAALQTSAVTDVHVLGRRGPLDAKFTLKELRELGELDGVDVVVDGADFCEPQDRVDAAGPQQKRSYDTMKAWAERPLAGARRRLHLHFWTAPDAATGAGSLAAVQVRRTRDGGAYASGEARVIDSQLLLRSVGYRGLSIDGAPYADETGTVPHEDYRVLREGSMSVGEYVAGWIARGPSGVLGTNRADADKVADLILADRSSLPRREAVDVVGLLRDRGVEVVECDGWTRIDQGEVALGQSESRARAKIATWDALMAAARLA
jgi:ferredoxin--NADP+ reductase